MKYIVLGMTALWAISCAPEQFADSYIPESEPGMERLTITVGEDGESDFIDTKSTVNYPSGAVNFLPGEKIRLIGLVTMHKSEFVTEEGGTRATFSGIVDSRDTRFLVLSPGESDLPAWQFSLPCDQKLTSTGSVDPSVNICYGLYDKTSTEKTVRLTPAFSLVRVGLDRNFRKVIFRAKDEKVNLCGTCAMTIDQDSTDELRYKISEDIYDTESYVCATSSAARRSVLLAALPATLEGGFDLEFYEWEDDLYPFYAVSTEQDVVLKGGTILDLGDLQRTSSSYSVYVRYNSLDFGFYFLFNGEPWFLGDPYEGEDDEYLHFISDLDYDYTNGKECPIVGQAATLRLFLKGIPATSTVMLEDQILSNTGRKIQIGGETYEAYTCTYSVADFGGQPASLELSVDNVLVTRISMPYGALIKCRNIDREGGAFHIGAAGYFITNGHRRFDYRLCQTSQLGPDALWQIRPYKDGWVVYQDCVDVDGYKQVHHRWFLQCQEYRDIFFTDYCMNQFDRWCKWTLHKDGEGCCYLMEQYNEMVLMQDELGVYAGANSFSGVGAENRIYINDYDVIF